MGRHSELAYLVQRLDATQESGSGTFILLGGEPGTGKTRLAAEVTRLAVERGWLVLAGRGYESEGMPAYLPFTEALRPFVGTSAEEELRRWVDRSGPEIALIVPEVAQQLQNAPARRPSSPEAERYQLFESVAAFLGCISEDAPTLLCLDDLHWADGPSLLLIEHAARRLGNTRVVILGTYRTAGPPQTMQLRRMLGTLTQERLCEHVLLNPLSRLETAELITAYTGTCPSETAIDAIYSQTAGNSFFVEEMLAHLLAEGRDLTRARDPWEIPDSVRQVVRLRLSRMTGETEQVLQAGAVFGLDFNVPLLQSITGLSVERITESLEEGLGSGLLWEDNGVRFRHPIVREVVYGGLSLPRRQLLHHRTAHAIEGLFASNLDAHLSILATHYRLAGPAADQATVIEYCQRAGDHALSVRAFEDSIRWYGNLIEVLEPQPGPDQARVAELHQKRGHAFTGLAAWPDARRELSAALDLFPIEPRLHAPGSSWTSRSPVAGPAIWAMRAGTAKKPEISPLAPTALRSTRRQQPVWLSSSSPKARSPRLKRAIGPPSAARRAWNALSLPRLRPATAISST